MRKARTITIEKKVIDFSCDFCDLTTTNHHQIGRCTFCNKDFCFEHGEEFWENEPQESWDSADMSACHECLPKAKQVWEIAQQVANRHDIMSDVVKDIMDNFEEYHYFLDDD